MYVKQGLIVIEIFHFSFYIIKSYFIYKFPAVIIVLISKI